MRKTMVVAAVSAMMAFSAVPAFAQDASTGDDNSVDNSNNVKVSGNRNQVGLNSSSQTLNQNATINSTQAAVVIGSGEIAQGGNSISASQKQVNKNVLVRNSFNRYHR